MKKLDRKTLELLKKGCLSVNYCSGCKHIHLSVGEHIFYLRKIRSKDTWFVNWIGWRYEARFAPLLGASPAGKPLTGVLLKRVLK